VPVSSVARFHDVVNLNRGELETRRDKWGMFLIALELSSSMRGCLTVIKLIAIKFDGGRRGGNSVPLKPVFVHPLHVFDSEGKPES